MAASLAPAALAAPGETPPYSLQYLDGIEGSEYIDYAEMDDDVLDTGEPVTQCTLEGYDVFDRYIAASGDWKTIIAPFCQRFIEAGFHSWTSQDSTYNETEYYFENGTGDRFVILGEKLAQSIMNESGIVHIMHAYSTRYIYEEEDTTQSGASTAPETPASLDNFKRSVTYTPGQFTDVPADRWFAGSVQTICELGLMNGKSAGAFGPEDNLTLAEAIVLASRIHSIYNTGTESFTSGSPWYQPYADYAAANGIYAAGADLTVPATRAIFAFILSKSLPESAVSAVNSIEDGAIPDLPSGKYADDVYNAVYSLYKAGVLTGSDSAGSFRPDSTINRAEAAAIVTRLVMPSLRKTGITMNVQPVTLYAPGDRTITVLPGEVAAYEAQGWSRTEPVAEARNTPIRIYSQPEPEINSADGVSFYLYWNNHSDKAIKYIHFYVTPYNRVNDPLKCDITGDSNVDCYETGPFYKVSDKTDWEAETYVLSTTDTAEDGTVTPALNGIHDGKSYRMNYAYTDIEEFIPDIPITPARYDNVFMRHYWDCVWYNNSVDHLVITKVVIEYMDGTSTTLTGEKLQECIY